MVNPGFPAAGPQVTTQHGTLSGCVREAPPEQASMWAVLGKAGSSLPCGRAPPPPPRPEEGECCSGQLCRVLELGRGLPPRCSWLVASRLRVTSVPPAASSQASPRPGSPGLQLRGLATCCLPPSRGTCVLPLQRTLTPACSQGHHSEPGRRFAQGEAPATETSVGDSIHVGCAAQPGAQRRGVHRRLPGERGRESQR